MFDSLSDRLSSTFKKIRGQGHLSEKNMQEGLREVRLALLEADVNFHVVKEFINQVEEKALGQNIINSLSPEQVLIKIVNDELVSLLGDEQVGVDVSGKKPVKIMLVGLQGSGKTTSCAKIANYLRSTYKLKPYLVPADVYRPAAIEQLKVLGKQLDIPVYDSNINMNPVDICTKALKEAELAGCDLVLFDTAGRLHIDEPLMQELSAIKKAVQVEEILFVADAMTGQDAVKVVESFNEKLTISGVVLTKMDGDARGGAALSLRKVTGKSIKFVGLGEKVSDLELFHPERIASRILGMGDIVSLVEKAQLEFSEDEAKVLADKMLRAEFDLEDFRSQMRKMKKLGSMKGLLKMIPGLGSMAGKLGDMEVPEKEMARSEAIINSMTVFERQNPKQINASRKERIAKGSGVAVAKVNQLLKQFEQMNTMMQGFMGGGKKGKMPQLPGGMKMPSLAGMGGMPGMGGFGGGMGGMDAMGDFSMGAGEGAKAKLSKKALAERKKKKLSKKQRKKH